MLSTLRHVGSLLFFNFPGSLYCSIFLDKFDSNVLERCYIMKGKMRREQKKIELCLISGHGKRIFGSLNYRREKDLTK